MGQLLVDGGSRGRREGLEPVADFGLDGGESVESFVESETGDSLELADPPVGWFVGVVQKGIESLIGLEAEELGFGDLAAAEVPPAAAEEERLDTGRGFQGTAEIGFHLEEVVDLRGSLKPGLRRSGSGGGSTRVLRMMTPRAAAV